MAAVLASAKTREYVEGEGQNGAAGQFVRLSDPTVAQVFPTTADNIKFAITAWGVYYEDTGEYKVRLMTELEAKIYATDVVAFEINFRPSSLPDPKDVDTIGEDQVKCDMTRSTSDGAFWTANVSEGWVACGSLTNVANRCIPDATVADEMTKYFDNTFWTPSDESTSDWTTPFLDDDPENFWCTKTNTSDGAVLVPYECSKLRCYMERLIDTSDTIKDLKFSPTVDAVDKMVILPRRAKVYINKSTFAFPAVNDSKIELTIPLGADRLLAATVTTLALATAALAF